MRNYNKAADYRIIYCLIYYLLANSTETKSKKLFLLLLIRIFVKLEELWVGYQLRKKNLHEKGQRISKLQRTLTRFVFHVFKQPISVLQR